MSRQAIKTLDSVLEGIEKIPRQDATRLLEYLGFKFRQGRGTHKMWTHPECEATVVFAQKRKSDPIWGYEMADLRKAVNTALQKAKQFASKNERKEQVIMPAVAVKQAPQPAPKRTTPIICLTANSFPEAVAELVFAHENKEITATELIKDLNSSGYRTASGNIFTNSNYYSVTIASAGYRRWKEEKAKQMQLIKPVEHKTYTAPPEEKAVSVTVSTSPPVVTPPLDPSEAINAIQAIIEENKRLKSENLSLQMTMDTLRSIICK